MKVNYIHKLDNMKYISKEKLEKLKEVSKKYKFRSNEYYLSLIDWKDENDPIRKIIIPQYSELDEWGIEDASKEYSYTISKGLQHKYKDTVLLLINDLCGGFCRFCFRKRLFINIGDEVTRDITTDLRYIEENKEITNVLLTGGDPLLLSTKKLNDIIKKLRDIDHIKIIRIGTKLPAFYPFRIIEDETLHSLIQNYSTPEKRLYFMLHINHPNEITHYTIKSIDILLKNGAQVVNQTPILKGINDDVKTLKKLFQKLSYIGVPPYYVFQNRPVMGNKPFALEVEKGYINFLKALEEISGLAKRPKFVMSHETGKIEISGITKDKIMFKYHRANKEENKNKFMIYKRNPRAFWFDDYEYLLEEYKY
ncbi:KamA family radical SAM protein [Oceanotoga sp. DSM 15011]|uniref:L-lysine 2,3-aminomutase n=1 Tax=Oceanotoga teriensis TaxID=515440 RepID=A0AA45C982_9BACT|nr:MULTISPECIES: radical SAM protein [Oceanotoga]MDN5341642.1 hypothetical protein [Oceanotoga sp.]MDO7977156.1 KamA family radical SAM protein [Oceanotoga teriensis]PWJ96573.1 L-lysine 2,3-aminomutase [Oceanotoga teriensis]UYP00253.1 KamA family radical SAM protein [Oceanotoga sp. DSM 15011]